MSKAFENIFPIGLGTGRFPFTSKETYAQDFENAVNLVLYALEQGVNYIDVGKGYSSNNAYAVLKEAFSRTKKDFNVTIKVNAYDKKLKKQDYYNEAIFILEQLGLEKASHFLLWTLMDSQEFHYAISKDSLYEAALQLKKEGKIKYIGASLHMTYDDIIEVIDSGIFKFLLISCNLMNFVDMQKVLDRAYEKGIDILVMNPLYGGLIPENESFFEYAKMSESETIVQAAIRAILSHKAVKCILAGASSKEQLDGYLSAISDDFNEEDKQNRLETIKNRMTNSNTFCSYCKYCIDCPKKIPVPQIMNALNICILYSNDKRTSEKMFFKILHEKFNIDFDSYENPCIKCGKCERKCTQHLNIIKSIDEVYNTVKNTCYDKLSRKNRFDELLNNKNYKKVGFWPASAGTMKIISVYKEIFGDMPFEVYLFDSNKDIHGKECFGYTVYSKEQAQNLGIDCILITSFNYGQAIYAQNQDLKQQGIDLKILYKDTDVDWWW